MYQLLTGRVPFPGGTLIEKLDQNRWQQPTPVDQLRPEVPKAVTAILGKLLAKKPEDRYATPAELAQALAAHSGPVAPIPSAAMGTTVAFHSLAQADAGTHGASMTIAPAAPGAIPVANIYHDSPKKPFRRRELVIAGCAVVLIGIMTYFALRGGDDGSAPGGDTSGSQAAGNGPAGATGTGPRQAPAFDPQWLAKLNPKDLPAQMGDEPLPPEFVAVLGEPWGRHWGTIRCAAFSPAGDLAASGGDDFLIRFWDPKTLEPRGLLKGPSFSVVGLVFSPDGKKLASFCDRDDWRVWLWNLEAKTYRQFEGHQGTIWSVIFSTDGRRLTSIGSDQTIRRWDVANGQQVSKLDLPPGVRCHALSPTGRHALTGHADKTLRLWDLETGKEAHRLDGHAAAVDRVAISPDGRRAVSVSSPERTLRLWNLEKGKEVQRLESDYVGVVPVGLAFSPSGKRVLFQHDNGTWLLDAESLSPNSVRLVSSYGSSGLALASDSQRVLETGPGTVLRLFDQETSVEVRRPAGHSLAATSVAFTPDGRFLLSGSSDSTVRLWDLTEVSTSQPQGKVMANAPKGAIRGVAYAPNGKAFAACGSDGRVVLWSAETLQTVWETKLPGAIGGIAFARDSQHLATANHSGTVYIFRLPK